MAFYIKQNDTAPAIRATLKNASGTVVDLTDADIKFHMKAIGENSVKVDAAAFVVIPATDGIVQYDWDVTDTDTNGSYQAEFEVTYPDSTVETFPNDGYIRVEIVDDIT